MKSILNILIVIAAGAVAPVPGSAAAERGGTVIPVADGAVAIAADEQCSLIEALENAVDQAQTHTDCEAGSAAGATLVLAEDSLYSLSDLHNTVAGPTGLPSLSGIITVEGNGATIERADKAPLFRLLHVAGGGDVTLEDLTLRGGALAQSDTDDGSGIVSEGSLSVHRVFMSENIGAGSGGAIANTAGGDLHVSQSTLQGNGGGGAGGNIYNAGTAFITHSTLGNSGCAEGGCALYNTGTATVVNSTLSSGGSSPGNVVNIGTLTLIHSTLANVGGGAPIFNFENNGETTIRNSIISGDFGGAPGPVACGGFPLVFEGVNLIEDGSCECDQEEACLSGNPMLGLLADHGGPTATYPLLEGSIAIDAAGETFCAEDDQRGIRRPQFKGCDLGSFEVQEPPAPEAAFEPASLAFGEVPVGNTSVPHSATLVNTGNVDLTGMTFSLTGDGFAADTSECGDSLGFGESCEIGVTFSPSGAGPADAVLSVTSNEEAGAELELSGAGIERVDPLFSDRFEQ